jgi:mitotic spindle assembly checkpoint protein MAD2
MWSQVHVLTKLQVNVFNDPSKSKKTSSTAADQENISPTPQQESTRTDEDIQKDIQSLFRQITASVTFLPMLDGNCTFNVLVYADADSEVPLEWGDSDAKEVRNAEKVQLRSFSTNGHRIDTVVSYRLAD